jgi:outer membrane protein OmpA-like peptidoglycan-associated protein
MVAAQTPAAVTYGKYEFVPGDSVIFADDLAREKVGEFPARWKLVRGSAELVRLGEAPAIGFGTGQNTIEPILAPKSFPAPTFTIEFDLYFHVDGSNEAYMVNLGTAGELDVRKNRVRIGAFQGSPPGGPVKAGWHRVAIAVKGRAMKVYLDADRILNIPELTGAPSAIQFRALGHSSARGNPAAIRDTRIAVGSFDPYEQLKAAGKFVSRGVTFDFGQATLRPEALGVLNQVIVLLNEHPEVKLRVEGHTDSDGDPAANQALSEQRAAAVIEYVTSRGIGPDRLSAAGWGESRPVSPNTSSESKANNRRVEFVSAGKPMQ